MKIGSRILKTAIGAGISIALAQAFQLTFYASAGTVTMLCIQRTRKKSYEIAWQRFLACLIGLSVAAAIFSLLGYNTWAITIILLISIPLMIRLKAKESVIASSVFIFHLYVMKHITWQLVINEIALMIIGITVGLLLNLFMPSADQELRRYQQKIEENFRIIFHEMARYLREGDHDWSGMEIVETNRLLKEAKERSVHNVENRFDEEELKFYRYFQMRDKQFDVIDHLIPHLVSFHPYSDQGEKLADFLDQLADGVHPGNTADIYLEQLKEMTEEYRNMPLPSTEEEFHMRATLFLIMNEIRRYLKIKKRLAK
ncbi:aromatic acid exporter family protein [Shimazuella sp. AN120528]|uniref:aromatic acid exporter family protein n=1 Tax=Shimazuella soli TaxID=1892854 RepID=UPI001F1191F9|nr:aromatic acid exporter family protein [Shimazuella soli]